YHSEPHPLLDCPSVPRQSHLRRLVSLVALGLLVGAVACSPSQAGGGSGSGNRIVTPAPAKPSQATPGPNAPQATATPAPASAPRLRGQNLSASDLYIGYRAILDNYVDPIDDTQLVKAAEDTLRQQLQDQAVLPMFSMPLMLMPSPSGDPDKD